MATKITSRVLADDAIVRASLGDDAIGVAEIADDAVTTAAIADDVALGGNPTTTTQSTANSSTRIATTAFVQAAIDTDISALIDSAPGTLNTLDEIAAALNDDPTFTTTVNNAIALKAPIANPVFTGNATFDSPTLYVDGSNNRVGIGDTTPSYTLDVAGTLGVTGVLTTTAATVFNGGFASNSTSTITSADNLAQLTLISTDADASVGPVLKLFRNSGSPADNDAIGRIQWSADDDAGNDSTFARIDVIATDVSNGSEDARMEFAPAVADDFTPTMSLTGGNVGIGTTSPSYPLHIGDYTDTDEELTFASSSNGTAAIYFRDSNQSEGTYIKATGNGQGGDLKFGARWDDDNDLIKFELRKNTGVKVGIGTTDPSQTLEVHNTIKIGETGQTGGRLISGDSMIFQIDSDDSSSTSSYRFRCNGTADNGTELMRIQENGNIGIATDDPSAKLHLGSASSFGNQTDPALQIGGTGNYRLGLYTTSEGAVYDNKNGDDGHIFNVKTAGEAVRIDGGTGYVGIGTPSPSEPLTIRSSSENVNTVLINIGNDVHATNTKDAWIRFEASVGGSADNSYAIGASNDTFRIVRLGTRATAPHSGTQVMKIGTQNVLIGNSAGEDYTGSTGVYIGTNAGVQATSAAKNVVIGDNANSLGVTTGANNIVIGFETGDDLTSGWSNILVGKEAGRNITEGTRNVCLGGDSGASISTASENVFVGNLAGAACNSGGNVGIGSQCLESGSFTSGVVAVGWSAGEDLTGTRTTLIGAEAGRQMTSSDDTVAVGHNAMGEGTVTGDKNVAVGRSAMKAVTSGAQNVAVGAEALDALQGGSNNTALGYEAMGKTNSGGDNVAIGRAALLDNTTSSGSVAVGVEALENMTGVENTAVGKQALRGVGSATGTYNVAIGVMAGDSITSGYRNTLLGQRSDVSVATGAYQIAIGEDCISTGQSRITVGSGNGDNRVWNAFASNASWARVSDERYKKDIQDNTDLGLDFIKALRPVTFKFKLKSEIDESLPDYDATDSGIPVHTDKMYGLIAQEVKTVLDDQGITDFGGWTTTENEVELQGISQEMFVHPLIKAIQELSAKNDALEARIATLEG